MTKEYGHIAIALASGRILALAPFVLSHLYRSIHDLVTKNLSNLGSLSSIPSPWTDLWTGFVPSRFFLTCTEIFQCLLPTLFLKKPPRPGLRSYSPIISLQEIFPTVGWSKRQILSTVLNFIRPICSQGSWDLPELSFFPFSFIAELTIPFLGL